MRYARIFVPRRPTAEVQSGLRIKAAVGLLGPRQAGKTTLALQTASSRPSIYLDLERREDRVAIRHPRHFVNENEERLVILDEVHRVPELFPELRGLIDDGRRRGRGTGRFLILGSASGALLRQSESLAGRILHVPLGPLDLREAPESVSLPTLWLRGGLLRSLLAESDADSLRIRRGLIETYLARDIPYFAPRLAVETMDRLWTMIAHSHGTLLDRAAGGRTRNQRARGGALPRPAGGPAARSSAAPVSRQCTEAPGQSAENLPARQRTPARPARHSRSQRFAAESDARAELGGLRDGNASLRRAREHAPSTPPTGAPNRPSAPPSSPAKSVAAIAPLAALPLSKSSLPSFVPHSSANSFHRKSWCHYSAHLLPSLHSNSPICQRITRAKQIQREFPRVTSQ